MKLLISPASPFARKARVVLREANLTDTVTEVDVNTTPYASDPTVVPANPSGKIPALTRPEGPALYDSRVICRYIDDRAGGKLYPKGPALWQVLTLEATADGMLDAAILMVYETRIRPEDKQFDGWIEGQWAKVSRALDALEKENQPGPQRGDRVGEQRRQKGLHHRGQSNEPVDHGNTPLRSAQTTPGRPRQADARVEAFLCVTLLRCGGSMALESARKRKLS